MGLPCWAPAHIFLGGGWSVWFLQHSTLTSGPPASGNFPCSSPSGLPPNPPLPLHSALSQCPENRGSAWAPHPLPSPALLPASLLTLHPGTPGEPRTHGPPCCPGAPMSAGGRERKGFGGVSSDGDGRAARRTAQAGGGGVLAEIPRPSAQHPPGRSGGVGGAPGRGRAGFGCCVGLRKQLHTESSPGKRRRPFPSPSVSLGRGRRSGWRAAGGGGGAAHLGPFLPLTGEGPC